MCSLPPSPPPPPHGPRTKKSRNKRHFSLDNGVFEVNTSLFRANGWDEKVYVVKLGKCLESNGRWFCLLQKKFGGRLNTIFAQGYENLNKPILRNSNARRGVGGGGGGLKFLRIDWRIRFPIFETQETYLCRALYHKTLHQS